MNHGALVETVLRFYPDTEAIYLFGSYGTGEEWPDSDVDIGVLLSPDSAKNEPLMALSECRYQLEKALKRDVDLINIRNVSTVFQFQIVTTGRLIHTGDQGSVSRFEMLTFSFYQKLNDERRAILDEFQRTRRAYPV